MPYAGHIEDRKLWGSLSLIWARLMVSGSSSRSTNTHCLISETHETKALCLPSRSEETIRVMTLQGLVPS